MQKASVGFERAKEAEKDFKKEQKRAKKGGERECPACLVTKGRLGGSRETEEGDGRQKKES